MNKCPNCNNTISSIDVLCPKCGALVEQINTNVAPKNLVVKEDDDPSQESTPSAPDQYENLIVYNESYQMDDHPMPPEKPDIIEPTIEDDFEIDNIITSANSAPRVNPLFAHIEKHRHDEEEPEEEAQTIDADDEDALDNQAAPQDESDAVLEQEVEEQPPIEADLSQQIDTPAQVEPISQDDVIPDDIAETEDIVDETPLREDAGFVFKPEPKDLSTPAQEEIAQVDQTELPDQPIEPQEGSLDAMPAYSQAYLDALKNIEMTEDELEIEESFDPDAFMAKFKKDASITETPTSMPVVALEDADDLMQSNLNQNTKTKSKKAEKEPRRRRYNPNKVKPQEEEIEEPVVAAVAPKEEVVVPSEPVLVEQKVQAPPKAKNVKKSKSKKTTEEDTFHKQSKAKVADDELLELTLEPDKFYASQADSAEDKEDEVFVFGQELEDPSADDDIKNYGPMNPYSAAVARPNTDVPKAASTIADPIPIKSGRFKRLPIWAAILIWLGVTAGILFVFYMFDNYFSTNYDGYGEYLSEISDSKINLDSLTN